MRKNIAAVASTGLMLVSMSGVALADSHEGGAHATIGGVEGKLGAEYRFELEHRDNGFTETEGKDASATNLLHLRSFNLTLDGKINSDVSYSVNYRISGDTATPYWATASWSVMPQLAVNFGHGFLNQGGWEWKQTRFDSIMTSTYVSSLSMQDFVEVAFETVGTVSLQFANEDVAQTNAVVDGSAGKQPMAILQYVGEFGPAKPLLQYGSYDNGQSNFLNLGVGFNVAGIDGSFDYMMDNRAYRSGNDVKQNTLNNMVLHVAYDAGMAIPFVKYAHFNVKEAENEVSGNMPRSISGYDNDGEAIVGAPSADPLFNDNSTQIAVGARFATWGQGFQPYAALVHRSGKFMKADGSNDEETNSDMAIKLGLMGKF